MSRRASCPPDRVRWVISCHPSLLNENLAATLVFMKKDRSLYTEFTWLIVISIGAVALGVVLAFVIKALATSSTHPSPGEWLQAATSMIGGAVGAAGAFFAAKWAFEIESKTRSASERAAALALLSDYSEIGLRDLRLLDDMLNANDALGTDYNRIAEFRFLNTTFIQSDIRDKIIARATPRGYVTFSRLHTLRYHALAKGKGHPFEATIHYSFGDFVWGIANAWIAFLDAAEADLGIKWLVEDPRPRLKKIRDRAAPLRYAIAAQEMYVPKDWGAEG